MDAIRTDGQAARDGRGPAHRRLPVRNDGRVDRTDRILTNLIRLVILPGLAAAVYLSYTKLTNTEPICATGGCSVINNSEWSEVFGIPVTLYGVAAYLTLIATTFLRGDLPKLLAAGVAVGGAAFSIFLQWFALFELERTCQWCLVSAVAMILLAGLTVARVLRVPPVAGDDDIATGADAG